MEISHLPSIICRSLHTGLYWEASSRQGGLAFAAHYYKPLWQGCLWLEKDNMGKWPGVYFSKRAIIFRTWKAISYTKWAFIIRDSILIYLGKLHNGLICTKIFYQPIKNNQILLETEMSSRILRNIIMLGLEFRTSHPCLPFQKSC